VSGTVLEKQVPLTQNAETVPDTFFEISGKFFADACISHDLMGASHESIQLCGLQTGDDTLNSCWPKKRQIEINRKDWV